MTDGRVTSVVAAIALVVAVIGLVCSIVSVSRNGALKIVLPESSTSSGSSSAANNAGTTGSYNEDRIWQLAFEHVGRTAYIDDATGELRGFHIDLATAICQIAGKNCQTVFDSPQRCWDSQTGSRPQGGVGIFAGYYDACVGWIETYERPRTFKFTNSHSVPIAAALVVKKGNTAFNWMDLTGSVIGIVDGWAYDEHCIAREKSRIQGWDLSPSQIMHYDGRQQMLDGLLNGEVDAIFDYAKGFAALSNETTIASDPITSCFKGAAGLMMRKDNGLDAWWNPALATLMSTSQWTSICNDISDEHGHLTGPEAEEFCVGYNPN